MPQIRCGTNTASGSKRVHNFKKFRLEKISRTNNTNKMWHTRDKLGTTDVLAQLFQSCSKIWGAADQILPKANLVKRVWLRLNGKR